MGAMRRVLPCCGALLICAPSLHNDCAWSRSCGLSYWRIWRQTGLWPATAPPTFFPCADAHSSRTKKLGYRRPPLTLRPLRVQAGRTRRLKTAIEAALGGFE